MQAELLEVAMGEVESVVKAYFKDKDGNPLALAPYQIDFIKAGLSRLKNRIIYVAATQSGKSESIAMLLALLALYSEKERIVNVSYTDEQAKIIFERVKSHLIDDSEEIKRLVDLNRSFGTAREFSKSRMFMKNGTEIRVMSTGTGETEKTGESLLGFEATILVVDEAGSIPDNIFYTKVLRMIGAKRSSGLDKMLILSGTPHNAGHFEEAWNDSNYEKFHVDWKKAVDAGRLDIKTIEEQKQRMTAQQFESWYEAKFPSSYEDSVFDLREIERNVVSPIPTFEGTKILSVDVARFGQDFTVYTLLDYCNGIYRVVDILSDSQKDLMSITGRIMHLVDAYHFNRIIVDETGLGGGVLDRLREQGVDASGIIAGASCTTEEAQKTFVNLKAELYLKAKKMFEQDKLKIIARAELFRDLRAMKKDFQSNGKLKIIDPEKSPDFSDSLVYGLFVPQKGVFFVADYSPKEKDLNSSFADK